MEKNDSTTVEIFGPNVQRFVGEGDPEYLSEACGGLLMGGCERVAGQGGYGRPR